MYYSVPLLLVTDVRQYVYVYVDVSIYTCTILCLCFIAHTFTYTYPHTYMYAYLHTYIGLQVRHIAGAWDGSMMPTPDDEKERVKTHLESLFEVHMCFRVFSCVLSCECVYAQVLERGKRGTYMHMHVYIHTNERGESNADFIGATYACVFSCECIYVQG